MDQHEIPLADTYSILTGLGVSSPSRHKIDLCQERCGSVLIPAQFKGGPVSFRNHMFKAYIRLRPSLNPGLDAEVIEAYQEGLHD